ncbi:little elongation complex subunit 1-like [Acipenser ruthenus]|uniref:little elongation complex subunit 1-like n=1 Tax=Acipenser ruthenus TaxID=7906 RepID=UPI0027407042|nr:little elongation complex subunit 1-like [Acipenser ruthenus]
MSFQNLNEYVAAVLALKQKIIDTEESSTLHHQLDELLLKCTPLEKQIEEIEAMKSELEEKRAKSSIKMYQQTYLEIESLKQENNETEAVNKKLEAQVKKLEETTTKQSQEIKQLKTEKNTLEKDLKRTEISSLVVKSIK